METVRKTFLLSVVDSLDSEKSSVIAQAVWIIFFAVLTALGAQIAIPHVPVPYTLQTFFVLLGAAFLGGRNGALSQILYLAAGAVGAPVFAGGGSGFSLFSGATGGYLIGFVLGAITVGYLAGMRRGYLWTLFSMAVGLAVVFACGTLFLYAGFMHSFSEAFVSGFLIFSWWDLLKLFAAAAMYNEFAKRYRKLPV
ncbi:MAG: biotin transporter BioY [Bacteroidota bacterium]|nr:biotin transporter BioY [Bacteroidota bacterium]